MKEGTTDAADVVSVQAAIQVIPAEQPTTKTSIVERYVEERAATKILPPTMGTICGAAERCNVRVGTTSAWSPRRAAGRSASGVMQADRLRAEGRVCEGPIVGEHLGVGHGSMGGEDSRTEEPAGSGPRADADRRKARRGAPNREKMPCP